MSAPITPDHIDPVIHERVRLSIVSTLAMVQEMSFNELKQSLSLTDGNLSTHARKLEDSGYIEIEKSFRGRRPHTAMRLTKKGRLAYQKYLLLLKEIIEQGRETT
jgi:DNA-binding transcriptional ArsR family regulator